MQDELDQTLAREGGTPHDAPADMPADDAVEKTAELPERDADKKPAPDATTTQPMPQVTAPLPEPTPAPEPQPSKPAISVDAPSLTDVRHTAAAWLKARIQSAGAFLSAHRLVGILAALACIAVVLGATLWGLRSSRMPSDEQINSDALVHLGAPTHTMGSFDLDEPLVLKSVDIVSKHASSSRNDACTVDVVALFTNASLETRADAQLNYVREGDDWTCTAGTVGSASHHATAAINEQLIFDHIDELLQAAEPNDDGRSSLSSIYRAASTEVEDVYFDEDAQTCEYALHLASGGTFVAYECDMLASFRFAAASGAWELTNVAVSKNAKDLGLSPLIGTWRGTFVSQSADASRCLAARDAGLTVTVTEAAMTDEGAHIEGTVTGVAHLHARLESDADSCDGDVALNAVPFSGTSSDEGLAFTCKTQDVTGGIVSLTLTFGSTSAPDEATAALDSISTHSDTLLLFIPYQRTDRFTDSFTLEKQQ